MYLPSREDIYLIESHLPDSTTALRVGLIHQDQHVRMCTAYVVEKLGDKVSVLAGDVRRAFLSEKKDIVKVYLADAMPAIGDSSGENVSFLKEAFENEEDEQVRTYVAGALLVVSGVGKEPEAWHWMIDSLAPGPPKDMSDLKPVDKYWERRVGASRVLGRLGRRALPALERMEGLRDAPDTTGWVRRHLIEDIGEISE